MRKRLSTVLVIFLIAAIAGLIVSSTQASPRSESAKPLQGKTIALLPYWLDNFGQAWGAWMKRLVAAQGGKLILLDGKADARVQRAALDDAVTKKVDGIIWHPVNAASAGITVKKIQKAKIPLVLFGDRPDPKKSGAKVPALLVNDYPATFLSGQHAARYIAANFKGQPPKIVAFEQSSNTLCNKRVGGFIAGVKSVNPDTKIVFNDDVSADLAASRAKMQDIISATPDFNVVISCGGDPSVGQFTALQAAGRGKAVNKKPATEWVTMIDGTPQQLDLLFDKNSSVMEVVTITPKSIAQRSLALLESVMFKKLAATSIKTQDASGAILPSKCQAAAKIFATQYGGIRNYKALDCSKYG